MSQSPPNPIPPAAPAPTTPASISVGTTPRAVVNLPAGNITAALKAIKPGTPNTEYRASSDCEIDGTLIPPPMVNCALTGGGTVATTLDEHHRLSALWFTGGHAMTVRLTPGSGTWLDLTQTDLEVSGFRFAPDQSAPAFAQGKATVVRVGKAKFHDCTLEGMCGDFVVASGPAADGCEIFNLKVNTKIGNRAVLGLGAWNVYVHDLWCLNNSLGEDLIRFTLADDGRKPKNLRIQRVTLKNISPFDKSNISIRECDDVMVEDFDLQDGWLRLGQDNDALSVMRPIIRNGHFAPCTMYQGAYPITQLQAIGATDVRVLGCVFDTAAPLPGKSLQQNISGSAVSTFAKIDSCQQVGYGVADMKPLVFNAQPGFAPTNCTKVFVPAQHP